MTKLKNHRAPYQHALILCGILLCAFALGSMNALAQLPVRTRSLQLISNNNTNLIEHRAPDGILSNFTYTWPSAYPTNPTDNFLTSTPTGTLAWANYDGLFWRLDGNAPATAASFLGPTSAGVPLNLSTSNAVPGSIDFYIGPVAPANRRITLDNTSFNVGTIADPVATNLNGTLSAEGTALINTVGTANTTIGNVGIGGSTVTLNAGTTGNIILGGVATDATPTELLTITAGGQVRRSTMSGTAQEGLVYSSGAYRLGGSANTDSPFLTDRFVNVDGSDLTFTANVGAETPLTIVGGVNSGVVLAASAGGDIVMTGVDVDVASTDFLTLDGSNRVRRAPVAGTAQEGITYSANAYRLGGPLVTDSPFLTNRFVNIDGSNLTITSNGGANTPFVVTGTANSGVALNADGLGTLELTGTTNINVSGTANTTIGNTGVGATTVTLNAGTTGNIVLGGVVTDATPTEILTITATNEVRRSTLSGTAQEGIVFTTGAYRLGGAANTDNPFLTNRFVNIDASNLSFTSDGGASTTMLLTGGVNSGVAMTTAGTGTIAMTGPTDVTGATTINTTGAANTTIGNTVGGGAVSLNSSGVNPITIDVGVNTNNLVLNNIATDATPTELLTITAGGQVRRSTMSGTAQEGVVYTAGAYRLGGAAVTDNPFLTDRYVNVDGSDLTFTSNGGANTPLVVTGGSASGVVLSASPTGNIIMNGVATDLLPTDWVTIDASNQVRRTPIAASALEGITYSGISYRLGGTAVTDNPFLANRFVNIDAFNFTITSDAGANQPLAITGGANSGVALSANGTGDIVLNGVIVDPTPTEILTITATNEVRRWVIANSALEGVYYSGGAYRLGGPADTDNPFLTNRFVNIDASNLSFTSDGGASTTLLLTGGANSGVAMTTAGTGTLSMTGTTEINTTGIANTTIGNTLVNGSTVTLNAGTLGDIVLGGVDVDASPTELLTITAGGQVRRSTMSGTAQEGIVFTSGAYRLGGAANTDNPFLTNRFVNIDASNLSFTSDGGASTTMLLTGGANSGVAMTTAGTGTITMTGPTDVTGATTINTTGTANTIIGNTGVGATTVTLNAGTTGDIVLGGVAADATPTELLTITAGGQVRRSTMSGTAQEGLVFTSGAYRLGGAANTDNPFLIDRFVNVDASDLSFTANGGAEVPLVVTGGAASGVILTASAAGNIVLNGVDVGVAATDFLTIDASNNVRRSPIAGSAQEGIVYTTNAYRLGGAANTDSPFLTNRFVNIDASNLSFTSDGGASTTMLLTGGANSGVAMTTAGTGTITMTGPTDVTGATTINTTGTANTTIGNTGVGATTVTLNAGTTGDIVLGGVDVDATPTELLTITAGGQVRRSTMSGTAQEGLVFTSGAYRLGGAANTDNPFLTNRFVNIDASNLSFTSDGGASTTMLLTGGANSGVAMTTAGTGTITMTGPTDVTGATTINTTGTANTTIGNTGVGATTITLNAGTTGNIVLGGVDAEVAPTEILTITATNEVRRSTLSGTAQEGIVFTTGAYRLGGAANTDNPFLTNRFVNIDASNLSFTSNGGASTPLLLTGGANSGVAMTTAGTGTIAITGPTNVTGSTTINTTGTANTSIGNTGIGATTISLNAGTTGNIVLGGVDAEVAPTEILTITATNEVRRSTLSGTAQEGLVFTAGAYRLGGTNATTNPFLTNRFVNIDASNLSFTSNGGASTTMLLTGGANSGVTMTTAGTGTITMTGPTNVTGATTINTTGTANTTIGNTGVGATTITLNAGTTGDIVLGGVDADATPTELLTITAGGQVRRSTMSGTAQEGLVFTSGAYRLGGAANTDNPLLADRFVNVDASDLSFTANGGAEVPLVVTGGAASGVILTASAAGNIVLNGVDVGVAATDFLTIDASNNVRRSPIAGIAQEGIVFTTGAYRLGGTANTDNPFLTNRFVNIDASNLSFTSDGGASTTMLLTGGANSGVAMTTAGTGTITMTGPTDVTGATTINTTGTANTTIGNTGVGATTVTLNAGATGNIVLGGVDTEATPTEILTITATNEVRRSTLSGTAQEGIVFTSGAYRLGGAANTDNPLLTDRFVNVDASDLSFTANGGAEVPLVVTGGAASGVILTASAAGNIVLNGVDVGVAATDFLTIDASNNVRRSPIAGSAQEGIVYTTNAYRLGGAANTDSPFLTNRFVNIDASNLSFTSDGGANTTLLLTGGANSAVTITPSGTGIFTVSGTPGVENIRAGSLSAVSADPIVAEGIVTADNSGDVRRRSTADALQILGIGRGIFTPAGASASHVISTGTFDLIAGATINVTVFGPTGAAVHAMVTNVDAGANQITVVTSATVDATFSLHWMIINP